MQIVCIQLKLFESCLRKRKKKKERKKTKNKINIFMFDFFDCKEKPWDSGAIFDIRIAKGFPL